MICIKRKVLGQVNKSLNLNRKTRVTAPQSVPRLESLYRVRIVKGRPVPLEKRLSTLTKIYIVIG